MPSPMQSILAKLQQQTQLSGEELGQLQSHIDQLEAGLSRSSHHETTSHHHTTALLDVTDPGVLVQRPVTRG